MEKSKIESLANNFLQFSPLPVCTIVIRLHGGSLLKFDFFDVNAKIFNEIAKFTSPIAGREISTTFLTLVCEFLDARIITNARF